MRTTLTLDDDVHAQLDERARQERRSIRELVNELLRRGLQSAPPQRAFRVRVHDAALLAGIDPDRLNALAGELEDDATLGRLER